MNQKFHNLFKNDNNGSKETKALQDVLMFRGESLHMMMCMVYGIGCVGSMHIANNRVIRKNNPFINDIQGAGKQNGCGVVHEADAMPTIIF